MILGTYYFYHNEKQEHIRIAMSWFAVGSEIGGLAECLFFILGPIAVWYNEKFKVASLINKFHFHKCMKHSDDVKLKPIRLGFKDILFSNCYNNKKPN